MRVLILMSLVLTFAYANGDETTNTTATPEVPPTTSQPPSSSSAPAPPSARIPRGTVYQIRPVNFRINGDNPFAHIEAVRDFKFPTLKGVTHSLSGLSPFSKYTNNNEEDSTAEEAIDLPKFIEALESSESEEDPSESGPSPAPPTPSQQQQAENTREKRKKSSNNNNNNNGAPKDASYAFGYTLDDQTRHEVADPLGNVNGYYQYIDDEGYVRKVVYTAGPEKGFVVLNKERVKGPVGVGVTLSGGGGGKNSNENKKASDSNVKQTVDNSASSSSANVQPLPLSFTDSDDDNREDTEESTYPAQPQGPIWVQGPIRESHRGKSRKPIYIVKIRRPQQSQGVDEYLTHHDKDEGRGHYYYEGEHQPLRIEKVAVLQMPIPLPLDYAPATIYTTPHYHRKRQRSSKTTYATRDESPLVFLAGSGSSGDEDDGSYKQEYHYRHSGSSEDNGQWDGDVGDRGGSSNGGGSSNNKGKPDGSYSFGYETETANRLEKADGLGNVRGSYSYIDSNGIKRTVHYVAGASTGFQVLGTSPSAARSVRIEAPPGFIVSRRPSKASNNNNNNGGSLALAASEYRYPAQPSAVIYHIHPDSGWKPWETSNGRKPRKMRKVMRVARKKPRTYQKDIEYVESPKDLNIQQNERQGTYIVQSHPPESQRPFRHSTRVQNTNFRPEGASPEVIALGERITANEAFFDRNRRPSHRAYTDVSNSEENDDGPARHDPVLFSPNYAALSEARNNRRPIPNPIVLQPSAVFVKNRGSNSISPYDVAESMVYPRRSTTNTNVPQPTAESLQPSESIHSLSNIDNDYTVTASNKSVSSVSTEVSHRGELIPVAIVTDAPLSEGPSPTPASTPEATQGLTERSATLEFPSSTTPEPTRRGSSSTLLTTVRTARRGRGPPRSELLKTPSPTIVRMTRVEINKINNNNDNDNSKKGNDDEPKIETSRVGEDTTMSSSNRLMQRLHSGGGEATKG